MKLTIEILQVNVIELRDATGLGQEHFAMLCGFSRTTLTDIENGKKLASLTTLNKISDFTTIGIDKFGKKNFVVPFNLREKLQRVYINDSSKSVILNQTPSVPYILKHKIFNTKFLDTFRTRKQILEHIKEKYGWEINPNTLTTNLKRMSDMLIITRNPDEKRGNIYKKNNESNM